MILQVGVKVLIERGGKYLFLQRSEPVENGGDRLWDIPGGRIDSEEALPIALSREVAEETGLVLDLAPELIGAQDIFVAPKDLHVVRLTYRGTAKGVVHLSSEHDEFEWLTLEEAQYSKHLDQYLLALLQTK